MGSIINGFFKPLHKIIINRSRAGRASDYSSTGCCSCVHLFIVYHMVCSCDLLSSIPQQLVSLLNNWLWYEQALLDPTATEGCFVYEAIEELPYNLLTIKNETGSTWFSEECIIHLTSLEFTYSNTTH